MSWIVEFDGQYHGPFPDEDACYAFAASVSREANDWTPIKLVEVSSGRATTQEPSRDAQRDRKGGEPDD